MGGMSFECPMCKKWFLSRGQLRDHAKDKHGMKNFTVEGVGSLVSFVQRKAPDLAIKG